MIYKKAWIDIEYSGKKWMKLTMANNWGSIFCVNIVTSFLLFLVSFIYFHMFAFSYYSLLFFWSLPVECIDGRRDRGGIFPGFSCVVFHGYWIIFWLNVWKELWNWWKSFLSGLHNGCILGNRWTAFLISGVAFLADLRVWFFSSLKKKTPRIWNERFLNTISDSVLWFTAFCIFIGRFIWGLSYVGSFILGERFCWRKF